MANFNAVLYESIIENISSLQKVRIKIDPAKWTPDCDINKIDSFTGYILQEYDDGTVQVYVPDQDLENPIMSIMQSQILQDAPDPYKYLKEIICSKAPDKGVDEDTIGEIEAAECIHVLVDIMKFNNFNDSEIIENLKEFISETKDV